MEAARDVIVVGSGAAGLTAASVAAAEGQRVLLLDSAPLVGGTTAISGGMVWVPANHKMAEAGLPDSLDAARTYLDHSAPAGGDRAVREAFLSRGDEALRYLEARTSLRLRPVMTYPDYYPGLPGATAGGRVLEPVPFDASTLGASFALLRPPLPEFTLFGGMMISRADIPHLRRAARSPRSAWHVARLLARYGRERLHAPRGTTLHLGNALVARLFKSALDRGVELRLGASVVQLLTAGGRVTGLEVERAGVREHLLARKAVILASGGLSQDAALRSRYVPAEAGSLTTTVPSGAASSGARLAQAAGALLTGDGERQAFWVPGSTFTRRDGTPAVFPHTVTDRGKPGVIAVDQQGHRFVNEALSYHEFVRGQLRAGPRAIPAWLVCDRRFLWRYGLGCVQPFTRSTSRIRRRRLPQACTDAEGPGASAEHSCRRAGRHGRALECRCPARRRHRVRPWLRYLPAPPGRCRSPAEPLRGTDRGGPLLRRGGAGRPTWAWRPASSPTNGPVRWRSAGCRSRGFTPAATTCSR